MVQMQGLTRRSVAALVVTLALAGLAQAAPAARVTRSTTRPHAAQSHAKLTAAQAEAAALKKFPGKITAKTKLENEEGTWQYGVMVQSGKALREVMVNAKTGKIDSAEVTTAGKEQTEAKAEAAKTKASRKGSTKAKGTAAKPPASGKTGKASGGK
jgi:hypothetical protein